MERKERRKLELQIVIYRPINKCLASYTFFADILQLPVVKWLTRYTSAVRIDGCAIIRTLANY